MASQPCSQTMFKIKSLNYIKGAVFMKIFQKSTFLLFMIKNTDIYQMLLVP